MTPEHAAKIIAWLTANPAELDRVEQAMEGRRDTALTYGGKPLSDLTWGELEAALCETEALTTAPLKDRVSMPDVRAVLLMEMRKRGRSVRA